MTSEHLYYIANLNVTQFRNFKKSVAILRRTGIDYYLAIEMIITAMQSRNTEYQHRNVVAVATKY